MFLSYIKRSKNFYRTHGVTSKKRIGLIFTFKSYSGLAVTCWDLNGEFPKVMRGKSSFEKRKCGDDTINKNCFLLHFSVCLFFILNYVPPFSLSILICGQILKGLAMFSWQGFSVFYRIQSSKQSAAQLAFWPSSHPLHFCQHDLTTWQASLPQMNSPMAVSTGSLFLWFGLTIQMPLRLSDDWAVCVVYSLTSEYSNPVIMHTDPSL